MTAKRFKVTDNTNNPFLCDWSVTDYADGGIVHHPMTSENMANVMCELLNELHEEKEQLLSDKEHLMGCLIRFFGYDDEDIDYNLNRESNREYGKVYYEMKKDDW